MKLLFFAGIGLAAVALLIFCAFVIAGIRRITKYDEFDPMDPDGKGGKR